MNNLQESLMRIQSEEMLSRFRSKEDIYKYMTIQSNIKSIFYYYSGSFFAFLTRAILSNEKRVLKTQEVLMTKVPQFEELSVKNLYPDAIKDQNVKQYLPEMEMCSNRFPERNFFFGILSTLKHDYLMKIIQDAQIRRYSINEKNDQDNNFIVIDQNWYQELIKHPYLSKKPGKAIHLIKQRSKLIRNKKAHHKFEVSQRLTLSQEQIEQEELENYQKNLKRQKISNNIQSYSNISLDENNQTIHFNI